MNKKVVFCIIFCVFLYWCGRIYSINQTQETSHYVQMGEEFEIDGISVVSLEAQLFSRSDFLEYFQLEEDVLNESEDRACKLICTCLLVSNHTERDMSWDEVMNITSCGFQTRTWSSLNMSYIGGALNVFEEESLRKNGSQRIWYVAVVNPICFKDKTWEQLKSSDFCYVLSLAPQKVNIQLE